MNVKTHSASTGSAGRMSVLAGSASLLDDAAASAGKRLSIAIGPAAAQPSSSIKPYLTGPAVAAYCSQRASQKAELMQYLATHQGTVARVLQGGSGPSTAGSNLAGICTDPASHQSTWTNLSSGIHTDRYSVDSCSDAARTTVPARANPPSAAALSQQQQHGAGMAGSFTIGARSSMGGNSGTSSTSPNSARKTSVAAYLAGQQDLDTTIIKGIPYMGTGTYGGTTKSTASASVMISPFIWDSSPGFGDLQAAGLQDSMGNASENSSPSNRHTAVKEALTHRISALGTITAIQHPSSVGSANSSGRIHNEVSDLRHKLLAEGRARRATSVAVAPPTERQHAAAVAEAAAARRNSAAFYPAAYADALRSDFSAHNTGHSSQVQGVTAYAGSPYEPGSRTTTCADCTCDNTAGNKQLFARPLAAPADQSHLQQDGSCDSDNWENGDSSSDESSTEGCKRSNSRGWRVSSKLTIAIKKDQRRNSGSIVQRCNSGTSLIAAIQPYARAGTVCGRASVHCSSVAKGHQTAAVGASKVSCIRLGRIGSIRRRKNSIRRRRSSNSSTDWDPLNHHGSGGVTPAIVKQLCVNRHASTVAAAARGCNSIVRHRRSSSSSSDGEHATISVVNRSRSTSKAKSMRAATAASRRASAADTCKAGQSLLPSWSGSGANSRYKKLPGMKYVTAGPRLSCSYSTPGVTRAPSLGTAGVTCCSSRSGAGITRTQSASSARGLSRARSISSAGCISRGTPSSVAGCIRAPSASLAGIGGLVSMRLQRTASSAQLGHYSRSSSSSSEVDCGRISLARTSKSSSKVLQLKRSMIRSLQKQHKHSFAGRQLSSGLDKGPKNTWADVYAAAQAANSISGQQISRRTSQSKAGMHSNSIGKKMNAKQQTSQAKAAWRSSVMNKSSTTSRTKSSTHGSSASRTQQESDWVQGALDRLSGR